MEEVLYEIEETKYNPRVKTTLDFKGNLENAEKKADEMARENIGTRYAVFRIGSYVAEYQAYYRTTVACPKCGEIIPIE
ncbi:MAG: hypothetical protein GX226_02680 [Dehalococcoidales bacterium]|nr:hypothetical protein [Dehalococcoidales bacterium]